MPNLDPDIDDPVDEIERMHGRRRTNPNGDHTCGGEALIRRRFAMFLALLGVCTHALATGPCPVRAAEAYSEYNVKAAILFNFVRFVRWPAAAFTSKDDPIVIAIVGDDPFEQRIDLIAQDKRIEGRPVRVVRWRRIDQIGNCHVAFVSGSERNQTEQVLARLGSTTLSVAEFAGFTERGGIVRFTAEGSKARFEVNLQAAETARLAMSSRLLSMARIVGGAP